LGTSSESENNCFAGAKEPQNDEGERRAVAESRRCAIQFTRTWQVFRSWIRKNSAKMQALLVAQVMRADFTFREI
jgi:hypothetical protein